MTPEQIKVLEALRDDGVLAGCIDVEEQKALTAALKFIEDMREIEAGLLRSPKQFPEARRRTKATRRPYRSP